jgi:hypothetical protein
MNLCGLNVLASVQALRLTILDHQDVGCQDVVVAPRLEPQVVRCFALRSILFGARMGKLILQENGIRVSVLKDSRFIAEPDRCAK